MSAFAALEEKAKTQHLALNHWQWWAAKWDPQKDIPLEYEDLQTICVFGSLRGNRRYCNIKNIKMEIEGGVQNDISKMCPEWKLVNIEVTDDYTSLSQDTLRIGDLIRLPELRVRYFPSNTAGECFLHLSEDETRKNTP